MDPTSLLRTAKLIAVPLPFFLSGYSFAFSQNAVPGIQDAPASFSTPVFAHVFRTGGLVVAPGALIASLASAYIAYTVPSQRNIWGTAAVINLGPLIWTGLVMKPGIDKLLAISQDQGKQEKATSNLEHRQLLTAWVTQNYVRAALAFIAGVAALRATVS